MKVQRYAVRVINSSKLWYVRTDGDRIITISSSSVPRKLSDTWTFEEIRNYHLENALRIRVQNKNDSTGESLSKCAQCT